MKTSVFPKAGRPLYFLHTYGVSPKDGSEKGVGYKWLRELGKSYNLVVFCEAEFAQSCFERLSDGDSTIYFRPVSVSEAGRRIVWNQGTWIAYLFLTVYHLRVLFSALQASISLRACPSIAHHLSMIGFRSPGYLALFKLLGAKVVWGPIGGLNTPPPDLYEDYGPRAVLVQRIKNALNLVCLALPSVLLWRMLADKKIVVVRPRSRVIAGFFRNSEVFPETFCKPEFTSDVDRIKLHTPERLKIVTTGKPNYRKLHKTLLIELDRMATELCDAYGLEQIELMILGCTDADLEKIGVAPQSPHFQVSCKFGTLEMVKETLEQSEVYVHLAVDEGTSHAVVEASSMGLPVICFNAGGHVAYLCEKDIIMEHPESRLEIGTALHNALHTYLSKRYQYVSSQPCENLVFPEEGVQKFLRMIDE